MADKNKQPSMMGAVFLLNKPAGLSSFAMVARLRRFFSEKKIGYTGTLDPFAEGVLPIFLGKATRLIPYVQETKKRYRALAFFGAKTSTQDICSEPISVQTLDALMAQKLFSLFKDNGSLFLETLNRFQGDLEQEIPAYSAKKVQGKKLYELARKGKETPKLFKSITVHEVKCEAIYLQHDFMQSFNIAETDLIKPFVVEKQKDGEQAPCSPYPKAWGESPVFADQFATVDEGFEAFTPLFVADLTYEVSKGSFIRTLVQSLGEALDLLAVTARLRRTASGVFDIENALPFEALERQNVSSFFRDASYYQGKVPLKNIYPPKTLLSSLPSVFLTFKEVDTLLKGQRLKLEITEDFDSKEGLCSLFSDEGLVGFGSFKFLQVLENTQIKRFEIRAERMLYACEDYYSQCRKTKSNKID